MLAAVDSHFKTATPVSSHLNRRNALDIQSSVSTSLTRTIVAALIAAVTLLATVPPANAVWNHAHGDSTHTGFADVVTAPARTPKRFVQLGPTAPGAGPVIGPDGTVCVGNMQGWLQAFHPDGTPAWKRQLPVGHAIRWPPQSFDVFRATARAVSECRLSLSMSWFLTCYLSNVVKEWWLPLDNLIFAGVWHTFLNGAVELPVTYGFDMSQRAIELARTASGGGAVNVVAPPNGNVAPPCFYLLFILEGNRLPSVGDGSIWVRSGEFS